MEPRISGFLKASKDLNGYRTVRKELSVILNNLDYWFEELHTRDYLKEDDLVWFEGGFETVVRKVDENLIALMKAEPMLKGVEEKLLKKMNMVIY